MSHTTIGIVIIIVLAFIAAQIISTSACLSTMQAFAKAKHDTIPLQKNNQDLFQSGKNNMASNIATNLICASHGPCIVE
jgi:hypothetical protein